MTKCAISDDKLCSQISGQQAQFRFIHHQASRHRDGTLTINTLSNNKETYQHTNNFPHSGADWPKANHNLAKFGPHGFFDHHQLDKQIPAHLRKVISSTANHSLAAGTWSSYHTSSNMLEQCSEELGKNLNLPLTENSTITFVGWMLSRGLSAATISGYLSGIRQKEIAMGFKTNSLRTPFINQIICGKKNKETVENITENSREKIPITPKMMLLIKKDLKTSNFDNKTQLLIWSACTLLFYGAFRGGEILSTREKSFDPVTTLRGRDISLRTIKVKNEKIQVLQIKLKSEKTNKTGHANIVDVYASNNRCCPIAAWKKWHGATQFHPSLPAFMLNQESAFTCKKLNQYLANFNKKYINTPGRSLSTHCFRSGLASTLAKIGYSDEEIQRTGRWSSRAFQDYIRLPRTQRVTMAREIARLEL